MQQKLHWNQWNEKDAGNTNFTLTNKQLEAMGLPKRPNEKNTYPIEQKIIIMAFDLKNIDGTALDINEILFSPYQDKKSIKIQILNNSEANWKKIQTAFELTNEEDFTKSHFNFKKFIFFSGQSEEQQKTESQMGVFAESFVRSHINKEKFINKTMELVNQKLVVNVPPPAPQLPETCWYSFNEKNTDGQFIISDEILNTMGLRRQTEAEKKDLSGPGAYFIEHDIIIKAFGLKKSDGTKLDIRDISYSVLDWGSGLKIRENSEKNWGKIFGALGTEKKYYIGPNGYVNFPSENILVHCRSLSYAIVSNIKEGAFSRKALELFNKKLAAQDDPEILVIPPIPILETRATATSTAVTPVVFNQGANKDNEDKEDNEDNENNAHQHSYNLGLFNCNQQ